MFGIKFFSLFDMFWLDERNFFGSNDSFTKKMTNPVIDGISQYSRYRKERKEPEHVEIPPGREGSRGEKERIPGKDRRDHKPRFAEYDEKKDEVCPQAIAPYELAQVNVYVDNEIKYLLDEFEHAVHPSSIGLAGKIPCILHFCPPPSQ